MKTAARAAVGLLIGLAGCSTAGAPPGEPPDAKAVILANKGRIWKDPDSIKNASIATSLRWHGMGSLWFACVELNAKNSFGGYTGLKRSVVLIYASGATPEVRDTVIGDDCADRPHVPFPELEGGYRPPPAAKQLKQPTISP